MSVQLFIDFDTDISRGRDNAISRAMNEVNLKVRYRDADRVLELIDGIRCTKEIADTMDKPIHKISGRFTALKQAGKIYPVDTKKIGNSVFQIYNKI